MIGNVYNGVRVSHLVAMRLGLMDDADVALRGCKDSRSTSVRELRNLFESSSNSHLLNYEEE